MSQDLKRHTPSQKSVNHETHSLYCIRNQSKSDFVWQKATVQKKPVKIEMQVKFMTSK